MSRYPRLRDEVERIVNDMLRELEQKAKDQLLLQVSHAATPRCRSLLRADWFLEESHSGRM